MSAYDKMALHYFACEVVRRARHMRRPHWPYGVRVGHTLMGHAQPKHVTLGLDGYEDAVLTPEEARSVARGALILGDLPAADDVNRASLALVASELVLRADYADRLPSVVADPGPYGVNVPRRVA